jgi:hypothetical protein
LRFHELKRIEVSIFSKQMDKKKIFNTKGE